MMIELLFAVAALIPDARAEKDKELKKAISETTTLPADISAKVGLPQSTQTGCQVPPTESPKKAPLSPTGPFNEFVLTEESYVKKLNLLEKKDGDDIFIEELLNPKSVLGGKGADDLRIALNALRRLNSVHERFLKDLKNNENLAYLLKTFPPEGFQQAYRDFVARDEVLKDALKNVGKKRLKKLIDRFGVQNELNGLEPEDWVFSLLSQPFQRVGRYPLLFKELGKTNQGPIIYSVNEAEKKSSEFAEAINKQRAYREKPRFAKLDTELRMIDLRMEEKTSQDRVVDHLDKIAHSGETKEKMKLLEDQEKNRVRETRKKLNKARDKIASEIDDLMMEEANKEFYEVNKDSKTTGEYIMPDQGKIYRFKDLMKSFSDGSKYVPPELQPKVKLNQD